MNETKYKLIIYWLDGDQTLVEGAEKLVTGDGVCFWYKHEHFSHVIPWAQVKKLKWRIMT